MSAHAEARKRARVFIRRIKRGEEPDPKPPAPQPTVGALAQRYLCLPAEPNCKPRTVELYRGVIDNHIVPALGDRADGSISAPAVARVLDGIPRVPGNPWVIVGEAPGRRLMTLKSTWRRVMRRASAMSSRRISPDSTRRRDGSAIRISLSVGRTRTGCRNKADPSSGETPLFVQKRILDTPTGNAYVPFMGGMTSGGQARRQ